MIHYLWLIWTNGVLAGASAMLTIYDVKYIILTSWFSVISLFVARKLMEKYSV